MTRSAEHADRQIQPDIHITNRHGNSQTDSDITRVERLVVEHPHAAAQRTRAVDVL